MHGDSSLCPLCPTEATAAKKRLRGKSCLLHRLHASELLNRSVRRRRRRQNDQPDGDSRSQERGWPVVPLAPRGRRKPSIAAACTTKPHSSFCRLRSRAFRTRPLFEPRQARFASSSTRPWLQFEAEIAEAETPEACFRFLIRGARRPRRLKQELEPLALALQICP